MFAIFEQAKNLPVTDLQPFNISVSFRTLKQAGKSKVYAGVPGNLVAFACRLSFQCGFEGNVSFVSKTQLIDHYKKTLGAMHYDGHLMIIDTPTALRLIDKYFKNQEQ